MSKIGKKYSSTQKDDFVKEIEQLSLLSIDKKKIQEPVIVKKPCIISVGYKTDDLDCIVKKVLEILEIENIIIIKSTIYSGLFYNILTKAPNIYKKSDYELERWYNSHSATKYNCEIIGAYVNNDNSCIIVNIILNGDDVRLFALNTNNLSTGVQRRQVNDKKIYTYISFKESIQIMLEAYIDRGFVSKDNFNSTFILETCHV